MRPEIQHYVLYRLFCRKIPTFEKLHNFCKEHDLETPSADLNLAQAIAQIIQKGVLSKSVDQVANAYKTSRGGRRDALENILFSLQREDENKPKKPYIAVGVTPNMRDSISQEINKVSDFKILHLEIPNVAGISDYDYLIKAGEIIRNAGAYVAILDTAPGLNLIDLSSGGDCDQNLFWLEYDYASFLSMVYKLRVFFFVKSKGVATADKDCIQFYQDPKEIPSKLILLSNSLDYERFGGYKFATHGSSEPKERLQTVSVLHISDIHLSDEKRIDHYINTLKQDLRRMNVNVVKYIVVSGDITESATEKQYDAAQEFFKQLLDCCCITQENLIVVPGNHDVDYIQSKNAYSLRKLSPKSKAGKKLFEEGDPEYWKRFEKFSRFYKKVFGKEYPLNPSEQVLLHTFAEDKLLFLSLNTSWKIDHYYEKRGGVNNEALSIALQKISSDEYQNDSWLKVAVIHHPISLPIEANQNFEETGFVGQLVSNGFKICLSGHVHTSSLLTVPPAHEGMHLVGVGTFGAQRKGRPESTPFQYHLMALELGTQTIHVQSRRKDSSDGIWWADARWGASPETDPKSGFVLDLRSGA